MANPARLNSPGFSADVGPAPFLGKRLRMRSPVIGKEWRRAVNGPTPKGRKTGFEALSV